MSTAWAHETRRARPDSIPSRMLTGLRRFVRPSQDRDHEAMDHVAAARIFRETRYLPVKGILPPTILDFLRIYYEIILANNRFSRDDQCPASLSLGGDAALDAILEWLRPEVSRLVGCELTPTYSYSRVYARGEVLARHTDRPACEISLTASVSIPEGLGPSTIFLRPPKMEEVRVEMEEGDGCLYAGSEVEHWREAFESEGYIQLFLHYIATQGNNFPEHAYDGRRCLGA